MNTGRIGLIRIAPVFLAAGLFLQDAGALSAEKGGAPFVNVPEQSNLHRQGSSLVEKIRGIVDSYNSALVEALDYGVATEERPHVTPITDRSAGNDAAEIFKRASRLYGDINKRYDDMCIGRKTDDRSDLCVGIRQIQNYLFTTKENAYYLSAE